MKNNTTKRQRVSLGRFLKTVALGLGLLAGPVLASPPSGYYQVWNDEFDGNSLDGSKWGTFTGTHRDAVNTGSAISVGGSVMTIKTYTSSGTHYTGFIGTQGKFATKFGYFEAFIDWNDSPGMWSAFWLQSDMMDDWPFPTTYLDNTVAAGTEIDICEHRSQNSSGTSIADQGVSNLHWNGYDTYATSTGSSLYGSGLNSGSHTYGLLWDSSSYRFYVDNSQVYSTSSALSQHSEWIVLSSEVLNGGWSGNIPSGGYGSSSSSGTKMNVAYIRYYAPSTMSFWDGTDSAYWTNSANWVSSHSPGSAYDIVFSLLSKGNYTTKLGRDCTVNSLSILESSYITIEENTLTINNLVDLNSAWNDAQINSDVILGNANTWRIGGGRTLAVYGNISGGHSLTLDGFGVAALYGNNSYTLGTTVNSGTLRIRERHRAWREQRRHHGERWGHAANLRQPHLRRTAVTQRHHPRPACQRRGECHLDRPHHACQRRDDQARRRHRAGDQWRHWRRSQSLSGGGLGRAGHRQRRDQYRCLPRHQERGGTLDSRRHQHLHRRAERGQRQHQRG